MGRQERCTREWDRGQRQRVLMAVRIFFAGLGTALRDAASGGATTTTPEVWSKTSTEALATLYKCPFLSCHHVAKT